MQQLPRPKRLQLDTGHINFNLVANFRFLAIFQILNSFDRTCAFVVLYLLLDRQKLGPAGVDAWHHLQLAT